MNIKDSYIHNGTAVLKDVKVESSVLKKILAGKDANDAYLGWETVCDLTGIKPKAAGTADKVGHKLTFSGGVTGTWDGSADKTVTIPTKSSWNYDDVYLKLTGNSTTNPLTGTIYIKDVNGIILNSKDKDLNIWEVYGASGAWTGQFGFNLQYTGTGSGNNNDLILWAHNQTGTHVESYRVKQDGTFIFKAAPKVGTNVMYHAGNLTASVIGGLGTLSNNISGNAATATKLYSTIVHPFSSFVFAYRKFASINIKQYEGKTALLLLKSYSTPSTLYGNSCKVYVNAYQQTSLGTLPRYNIETDCDDRFFSIYAVVNYTSTLSTIDLYVYGKEMSWYSIDVTLLSGDNIIDIGNVINNLPDGIVITPTKYGSVHSATKFATARTIWGQSFDGTKNISGALTEVTDITASGNINLTGSEPVIKRNGINIFRIADTGIVIHPYSDSGTIILRCGVESDTAGNKELRIIGNGNVGIGTTTPEAKLHINGSLLINNISSNEQSIIFRTGKASDYTNYDYKIGKFTDVNDINGFGFAMSQNDGTYKKFFKITSDGAYHVTSVDILTTLNVSGYTNSTGFKKNGSNDSYVLLGGGGHKLESSLSVAKASDSNTLAGYSANNFAFVENTYGTTGNFVNGIETSNYIARGDLGLVGFDNSSTTVELYEAASGSSYPSSPTKTINIDDATYGASFKKGVYALMHTCAAGAKLKIIVKTSANYIKSVGIYINAGGNTISFSSMVDSITKTGQIHTWGSWHIFSCMSSNPKSITIELNTTNVNCKVEIGGFRSYITNPTHLRFPGVANSADSVSWTNITNKPSSFTPATHTHTFASLTEKPTTISGYGITDGLRKVTLANNVENDFNTFENLTLTGRGDPTTGSSLLNSPWTTQPAGGFGALTYLWSSYGLQLTIGYNSNDIYIRSKYYHAGGSNWSTKWDKILNSSNYNSYAPKLDGTGATGTWKINISGNAATATTATNLSKKPSIQVGTSDTKKITITAGGKTSDEYIIPFATASDKLYAYTIAAGTDVNTLKDFKYYVSNSTSVCASIVNGPVKRTNGEMWFLSIPAGASSYGQQLYYSRQATNWQLWTRTWANNSFSPWVQFIHSGNISSQSVSSATTSTYASNVGSAGTAGTNYVTAANVISMYNWYNSITATDEASNTAIDKWNEIVSFLAGITDTSTLSGILAGYAAAGHDHDKTYLKLSGGNVTGKTTIRKDLTGNLSDWVSKQHLGPFEVGRATNSMCVAIGVTDDNYGYIQVKGANITTPGNLVLLPGGGNLTVGNSTNTVYHKGNLSIATLMGSTAIGDSDEPVYWNGAKFVKAGAYPTKLSWNYDDRYLKLSGGTLAGILTINTSADRSLILDEPSGEKYHIISFRANGEEYASLCSNYLNSENNLIFNGNIIYHSGNLPAYPTVNNGALYLQANGTTKVTFTANQSDNSTLNIATGSSNGTISVGGTNVSVKGLGSNAYTSTAYLPLAGGTMDDNAQIKRKGKSGSWIGGRDRAIIRETSSSGYHPLLSLKTKDGSWELGEYNTSGLYNVPIFSYVTDTDYSNSNNTYTYQIRYPLASGTIALTADLKWSNVASKPETATRWPTWSEVTNKPSTFPAAEHNHDGRYLRWNGSAADVSAMAWGTLTAANGYTILSHAASSDGGDWGMVNKGGKIYMQLDGYYYQNEGQYRVTDVSETVTALGTSGNYLTWTKNGTTNNITVPYATKAGNADTLDNYHENDFFRYRGQLYQKHDYDANTLGIGEYIFRSSSYGTVGTGAEHVNALNENSTIQVFKCLQLSATAWSDKMSYRLRWGDETNAQRPNGWSPWIAFISSSNYTEYTVKKDGTGASGTWKINVTGSAGSVERATFGDRSNATHDANAMTSNGLYYYSSNGPTTNAHNFETNDAAMYVQAYNTSWVSQIAQDYRSGKLAVRSRNNGTWQPWRRIAFADSDYIISADRMYYEPEHRKFTRTASGNSWDTQAYSVCGYKECRVTYKISQTGAYIMVGLNSDPTTDASYQSIDYCWYTQYGGELCIYENGNYVSSISGHTTYAVGDELIVEYSCGQVRYYHNGVLCRTVARTYGSPLYFDCSFYQAGSIENVVFEPIHDSLDFVQTTASYSLSNASWINTITLPTTAGSYILNIVSGNSTLTGVFSIGASDNAKDEISLHLHGNGPRLYARTNGTTLQLSSNDASATSRSVTIKYRRMI